MAFKTSNSSGNTTPYSGSISNTRGLSDITDLDATTIATLKSALTYNGYEPYEPTQVLNASSTGLTGADITGLMFGGSLYVYGNYVFISAEQSALGTPPNEYNPPVWVYNVTTGSLVHTLSSPSLDKDSSIFGEAMSISGNYAILGQDRIKNGSTYTNGRVYIYNVATGALVKTIESPDSLGTLDNGYFGKSVAIEGNYAIVGAYLIGSDTGADDGKAYIYKTTDGTWSDATLIHTLNNPNPFGTSTNDNFGAKVSINSTYAVVSAVGEDTATLTNAGKVYIYNIVTGTLFATLDHTNITTGVTYNFGGFGYDVSMTDEYITISAPGFIDNTDGGKVHIYKISELYRPSKFITRAQFEDLIP